MRTENSKIQTAQKLFRDMALRIGYDESDIREYLEGTIDAYESWRVTYFNGDVGKMMRDFRTYLEAVHEIGVGVFSEETLLLIDLRVELDEITGYKLSPMVREAIERVIKEMSDGIGNSIG